LTTVSIASGSVGILPPVSTTVWGIFTAFVVVLLFLDLVVFNRKHEVPSLKRTSLQVGLFVTAALVAGVLIGVATPLGWSGTTQYFAAYAVEWSLSVDNIFVISLIMAFFAVPRQYQHKVLFYGVMGAIVMRLVFIGFGMTLVHQFTVLLPLLGLLLVYSGLKLLKSDDGDPDVRDMRAYKIFTRVFPVTNDFQGPHFLSRAEGGLKITPLLLTVLMVEVTDLIFAVDSVPAVLAISSSTFVAFSSNVMAILGLRSVYFLFDYIKDKLSRLNEGLAIVLSGIGVKMVIGYEFTVGSFHWAGYHVPTWASLVFILVVLTGAVIASLIWPEKDDADPVADEMEDAPDAQHN
jgi:tellurite resistance protein TerC